MKFKLLKKAHHKFFRVIGEHANDHDGKIAIADDSGGTPDTTNDGVLFLDFSKPAKKGTSDLYEDYRIPLKTLDGDNTITIMDRAGWEYYNKLKRDHNKTKRERVAHIKEDIMSLIEDFIGDYEYMADELSDLNDALNSVQSFMESL